MKLYLDCEQALDKKHIPVIRKTIKCAQDKINQAEAQVKSNPGLVEDSIFIQRLEFNRSVVAGGQRMLREIEVKHDPYL